ncbi:TetR/AcrR family transcriptional regulator [Paractinoplanes rishiriensis]|uniref:TetR family transcriptional regulator n=1 Tax=Paractinoplanes rishiriensis TaxID=1050105 RepID=A0A919KAX0_9ACTN|nr:TetR/AcrR family transcriptional regulator [Actinoplanes rishiriensis]GIE99911.1 TetR family transcriptional regulator [Actinoplanes rishiriensis]
MRPDIEQDGQKPRTFIEEARRAQIVESAIAVVAEAGFAQASLARIAKRAGISRGLISYHFAGKIDLISEVLVTVFADVAACIGPRVEAETSAAAQLRAYIQANLAYMDAHRARIAAVVEIISAGGLDALGVDPVQADREALKPVVDLFRRGQADGEFRQFDPEMMARVLRGAIDSMAPRLTDTGLDLPACARELTTMFDLATAR